MRIPGFAVTAADRRAGAGDRLVPQQFTCEEELGPVCRHRCRNTYDPAACVRRCLKRLCAEAR
ncbi:hypothetical protein ABT354_12475 [Streptomyces sp. NPDC000594]|uniref:hypothetical protein n=1 Tax=Streptomyces sp. NPDC000594 TaxID=3154261 RepID=UPI00332C923F